MLSRKQMIGLAITRMMMQDKWAEKYDPDNRFGINQYDYNLEKDYLFALQRELSLKNIHIQKCFRKRRLIPYLK